jgi:hypothetical protein
MSLGSRSVLGVTSTGGGAMASLALNLTALMDILSNLLFFLLASYTSQSVELEGQSGLRLPSSTSQLALTPQVTITISESRIDVGGVAVGTIQHGVVVEPLEPNGNVGPLFERLHNIKVSRESAGRGDLADASIALLLADKKTDAETVTTVLKTAGRAGFTNMRFGVISK